MNHGGRRPHAGRKKGSGRYGEPTKAMRVPVSRVEEILKLIQLPPNKTSPSALERPIDDHYWRPLYDALLSSFFAIPRLEPTELFNLNAWLLPYPERMAFVRVPDASMSGQGIDEGALLIVDRHLLLTPDCIIAAFVKGELVIRRVIGDKEGLLLAAANPLYAPIPLTGNIDVILVGAVTTVIQRQD
jgi:DNA polymerase V